MPITPLSSALAAAIVSRRTAADITHLLALPSTPMNEAVDTLYQTIRILDIRNNEESPFSTWGVLREALVVYRYVGILPTLTITLTLGAGLELHRPSKNTIVTF